MRPNLRARRAPLVAVFLAAAAVGAGATAASAVVFPSAGWKLVPIAAAPKGITNPGPAGGIFGNMVCLSRSNCWSAGTGENQSGDDLAKVPNVSFLEHWTGKRFKLVKSPDRGALLQGVACVSRDDCWVAGGSGTNNLNYDQISSYKPLIGHWNGHRWKTVSVHDPSGTDNQVSDVSCTSKSNCYAVGWTSTSTDAKVLIMHWNGKHWSVAFNSAIGGEKFAYLDGIDCVSKSVCIAVGQEQTASSSPSRVFGEQGSGSTWTPMSMPNYPAPNDDTELYGLSCTSSSFCMAAGAAYYFPSSGYNPGLPFAEKWNGKEWSLIQPTLTESGGAGGVTDLTDVSCVSSKACWAVGATAAIGDDAPPVTAFWNGTSFALGANTKPANVSELDADYCLSSSDCLAVGYAYNDKYVPYVFAERLR